MFEERGDRAARRAISAVAALTLLAVTACGGDGGDGGGGGGAASGATSGTEPIETTPTTTPTTTGHVELEPGWLVVAYQAVDNNLESAVLGDIAELGEVAADDLDVVVLLDRSDESDPAGGYSDADSAPGIPEELGRTQILHGGSGGVSLLTSMADVDTGDPRTLATFMSEAITKFPREHVAVVIGDHGAAWHGVAWDDASGDSHLSLADLRTAMEQGLADAGRDRIDLVGFDACLMASLEVAATLAPFADYLVASEEVEPGAGWDWTVLDQTTADMDPRAFGTLLVDGYTDFYADETIISNQTMSLVDLTEIDSLQTALADLADVSGLDATTSAVGLARSASRAYSFADSPDPALAYHQFDIGNLMRVLAVQNPNVRPAAEAVLAELDEAVLYETHGSVSDETSGLSIYLPPHAGLARPSYFELPGITPWQGLVRSYLETTAAVEVPPAFDDPDKFIEGAWTSEGFQISSAYDPAAEATVVDARLRYGTYDDDYTSMIFYGDDPLEFGNGNVSGVWNPQFLRVTDGEDSAFAYSTLTFAGDRSRAIISVPMEYRSSDGSIADRVELRLVVSTSGELLSKDFVVFSSSGIGKVQLDPAGLVYPLAASQSLDTFEETWVRTLDVGLYADLDRLDATYVALEEATPIVAQLELHALDGSVDFVYGGDAVPAFYHEQQATFPAPD